jgi:predicted MFS family arabinose efflux permease
MKHANGNFIEPMQPPEWSAKESARTAPFWMLMITGFVISAGYYFVITHIVTYAIDNRISASAAALILTMMSIGGIGGSLLAWSIAAKLGTRYALLVLIAAQALAMFLFIWIRYLWLFYTTAILFGFSFAAAIPVRMSMIPQFFGMKSIGMIMGFATFAWSLGGIVGPVLAGYIFDISGSYSIAFLSGGLLLIIGVFAVQLLKFR